MPADRHLPSRSAAAPRYDAAAIALHWLLALAIVATFALGLYMADLPFSLERLKLYNWHKWAGASILALSALRLVWRLLRRPPPAPAGPAWQQKAGHLVHALIYAAFFAVPLTGWAYSSAAGFPIVWFGVLPLPDFVPVDKPLAAALKEAHEAAAWALALLVALHLIAVLKHQLIDRDGVLLRMLPAPR
jgi:cytochrome b561